ncbi:phosphotransferase family protein [Nocardioides sp.]|uniref:phosphotransferase family protein n=2 Tax=Nocardioides sp. TaxID=35761 RepID=UPI003D114D34
MRQWMPTVGQRPEGRLSLTRVGLGQSNLTFRLIDQSGKKWVLRRPPLGRLLESAHDVAREARILKALGPTAVPVPQVYGELPRGATSDGAPAFLMSWVDGNVVDTMNSAEALDAEGRRSISVGLARTLARIHAVDVQRAGLSELASHKAYAPRQLKRWKGQWEQSKTRELPRLDDLTLWLEQRLPVEREVVLVHGDFHVRNVIVTAGTSDVAAVLDWELSSLGHPLADLGTLLAYWPHPGEVGLGGFTPTALPGFLTRDSMIAEYARASEADVGDIVFWQVLALWKLAIIAEGVLRRTKDQPLNKAAAGAPEAAEISGLVDRAWHVIAHA